MDYLLDLLFPWRRINVVDHSHTLVPCKDYIETKQHPYQERAAYAVVDYHYKQSVCMQCGRKFQYDLIKEEHIHDLSVNGRVLTKKEG